MLLPLCVSRFRSTINPFVLMSRRWRRWQPCRLCHPAQSVEASHDAAQPSSRPGSAEHPGERLCRARNGKLYSQTKLHEYYGCYVGEARWQKAQDEITQSDGLANVQANAFPRRRTAEQPVAPFGVKRTRLCSPPRPSNPDQPAASLYQAAQLALREVRAAVHATHRDHMLFLEHVLKDVYGIRRSVN